MIEFMFESWPGTAVQEAITALLGAYDAVAACGLEDLPVSELLAFIDGLEALTCQLPTQSHRALARLQSETTATELGAKSWKDVLAIRWRLTTSEANRRLHEASELGPRRTLTGAPLPPLLPAVAASAGRWADQRRTRQGAPRGDEGPTGVGRRDHPSICSPRAGPQRCAALPCWSGDRLHSQ